MLPLVSCPVSRCLGVCPTNLCGWRYLDRVWVEGRRRRCPPDDIEVFNAFIFNVSCIHPKIYPWKDYFVPGGSEECINGALDVVDFSIFSSFEKIESIQSDLRIILTTSPIWSGVVGFVEIIISFSPIDWMCLIWLNIDLFYWWFFLTVLFVSQGCNDVHFPVSFWIDISSRTCWNVVDSFIPIIMFLVGK